MKKVILVVLFGLFGLTSFAQDYNWKNADVLTVKEGVFTSTFPTNRYRHLIQSMHVVLHTKEEVIQFYDDILNAKSMNGGEIIRDNYSIKNITKKTFTIAVGNDVSAAQFKKYIKPNKGFMKTKDEAIKFM